MDVQTILVTGNAGFIGTFLTRTLIEAHCVLRGIDTRENPYQDSHLDHVIGSILDQESVQRSIRNADCIIHLAAEHKDFGVTREQYFQVNKEGTETILRCAAEQNVKKFVFFSSVAVYGGQQGTSEETPPLPVTPYGESKLAAENALRRWASDDPTRSAMIIRPTVVFGPRNRANIFRLVKQICDKRFVWVGHGRQIKSVAYVENLVEATVFLLQRMKPGVEVFNYSDEPHMSMRELVDLIARKAERSVSPLHIPLPLAHAAAKGFDMLGSILGREFPITSARIKKFNTPTHHKAEKIRGAGFVPRYSIAEGIERNVRWYLEEVKNSVRTFGTSD